MIPSTRARFTWLCAVSPYALLFAFSTMALHVRLGFGYWPDQAVDHFPAVHFMVHECMFLAVMLFAIYAVIHLAVTFIHHRAFGVKLKVIMSQMLLSAIGWVTLFVVIENAPARFVTWFTD